MKISQKKLETVVEILKSFGADRVIVFGSYVSSPDTARDIDLGVEGIPLSRLGAAEMAIYQVLRRPFDLVSREETPEFFALIAKNSGTLYE